MHAHIHVHTHIHTGLSRSAVWAEVQRGAPEEAPTGNIYVCNMHAFLYMYILVSRISVRGQVQRGVPQRPWQAALSMWMVCARAHACVSAYFEASARLERRCGRCRHLDWVGVCNVGTRPQEAAHVSLRARHTCLNMHAFVFMYMYTCIHVHMWTKLTYVHACDMREHSARARDVEEHACVSCYFQTLGQCFVNVCYWSSHP